MGIFDKGIRGDVRFAFKKSKGIWYYEEVRTADTNVLIEKHIRNSNFESLQDVMKCFNNVRAFGRPVKDTNCIIKVVNKYCIKVIRETTSFRNDIPIIETLHFFTEEYGKKKGLLVWLYSGVAQSGRARRLGRCDAGSNPAAWTETRNLGTIMEVCRHETR